MERARIETQKSTTATPCGTKKHRSCHWPSTTLELHVAGSAAWFCAWCCGPAEGQTDCGERIQRIRIQISHRGFCPHSSTHTDGKWGCRATHMMGLKCCEGPNSSFRPLISRGGFQRRNRQVLSCFISSKICVKSVRSGVFPSHSSHFSSMAKRAISERRPGPCTSHM